MHWYTYFCVFGWIVNSGMGPSQKPKHWYPNSCLGWVWEACLVFPRLSFFLVNLRHCLLDLYVLFKKKTILKLGSTVLFIYLKIILLQ